MSLAGQLLIFETLFGLLLVYIWEHRLPDVVEALGIFFMLTGVSSGVRNFYRLKSPQNI
jgi:hypothetical protein